MSHDELNRELQKGLDSMQSGKMYSVEELDAILKEDTSQ